MPLVDAVVQCPIYESFRVKQVEGLFDLPAAEKARATFSVEVPGPEEDWRIGAIVGPSGSGKSTIARQAFGDAFYREGEWPETKAVIDDFGRRSVKEITAALTAVGFSSPPSWILPYRVLSGGQQFRCELARALLSEQPLVVFDEFTSVVDRTAARIGSAAVAKAVRRQQGRRFVAVTCHYDVLEWLEADWVLDMGTRQLARGGLQRPPIELEVFRCHRAAWRLFGPHHYLSSREHTAWQCYLATWQGEPVAMVAVLKVWGYVGYERISRIVVLPDYQGVGIGRAVLRLVARQRLAGGARRVSLTTGHPGMIRSLERSGQWRCTDLCKSGGVHSAYRRRSTTNTLGRCVVRFVYCEDSSAAGEDDDGSAEEQPSGTSSNGANAAEARGTRIDACQTH